MPHKYRLSVLSPNWQRRAKDDTFGAIREHWYVLNKISLYVNEVSFCDGLNREPFVLLATMIKFGYLNCVVCGQPFNGIRLFECCFWIIVMYERHIKLKKKYFVFGSFFFLLCIKTCTIQKIYIVHVMSVIYLTSHLHSFFIMQASIRTHIFSTRHRVQTIYKFAYQFSTMLSATYTHTNKHTGKTTSTTPLIPIISEMTQTRAQINHNFMTETSQ